MDRFFKTCLLWLLALVLPVQGFATAIKDCGPAHRHRVADHRTAQAMHYHDSMLHGGHHHQLQAAADYAAGDASHTSGKHLGSACCLAAVMLPSVVRWSPVPQRIAFALAPPASRFSGYIPEGLKRPPRATPV